MAYIITANILLGFGLFFTWAPTWRNRWYLYTNLNSKVDRVLTARRVQQLKNRPLKAAASALGSAEPWVCLKEGSWNICSLARRDWQVQEFIGPLSRTPFCWSELMHFGNFADAVGYISPWAKRCPGAGKKSSISSEPSTTSSRARRQEVCGGLLWMSSSLVCKHNCIGQRRCKECTTWGAATVRGRSIFFIILSQWLVALFCSRLQRPRRRGKANKGGTCTLDMVWDLESVSWPVRISKLKSDDFHLPALLEIACIRPNPMIIRE